MQGYVLLKKSQMVYEERDAHRVVAFAEAARQGPWALPLAIQAEVTQQHALGMAMVGEPIGAVEQQMRAAREMLGAGRTCRASRAVRLLHHGYPAAPPGHLLHRAGKPARAPPFSPRSSRAGCPAGTRDSFVPGGQPRWHCGWDGRVSRVGLQAWRPHGRRTPSAPCGGLADVQMLTPWRAGAARGHSDWHRGRTPGEPPATVRITNACHAWLWGLRYCGSSWPAKPCCDPSISTSWCSAVNSAMLRV